MNSFEASNQFLISGVWSHPPTETRQPLNASALSPAISFRR
jgi:hypothetical protein